MGRGRAKAKQVKVARQLKYNSDGPDFDRLREELATTRSSKGAVYDDHANDDELADRYDVGDDEDDEPRNGSHR